MFNFKVFLKLSDHFFILKFISLLRKYSKRKIARKQNIFQKGNRLKRTLKSLRSIDSSFISENNKTTETSDNSFIRPNTVDNSKSTPIEYNNFQKRGRRKKQYSKSCTNLATRTITSEKNVYTLESLTNKLTQNHDNINIEFKTEFLQINNFLSNKTFDDSLKIHNERKSRYKNIYPCKIISFIFS